MRDGMVEAFVHIFKMSHKKKGKNSYIRDEVNHLKGEQSKKDGEIDHCYLKSKLLKEE